MNYGIGSRRIAYAYARRREGEPAVAQFPSGGARAQMDEGDPFSRGNYGALASASSRGSDRAPLRAREIVPEDRAIPHPPRVTARETRVPRRSREYSPPCPSLRDLDVKYDNAATHGQPYRAVQTRSSLRT